MISAIVISFSDHNYIKDCIASLAFVDEVIIVGNIDPIILLELKHHQPIQFVNSEAVDLDQLYKQASLKTTHDWILGLEANHCISKQLSQEIMEARLKTNSKEGFKVKIEYSFMGKLMKFSGYKTSYTTLLFHKKLHNSNAVTRKLKHPIKELYKGFDSHNERLNKKAKLSAKLLYAKNIRPNFIHFLCKPVWEFKTNYIFKLCVLDGKEGFIFAYLKAFNTFKTYLFLWLLYRNLE